MTNTAANLDATETYYETWINHFQYAGWGHDVPDWSGYAIDAERAAEAAVGDFLRLQNVQINSLLTEPVSVRVFEPYNKTPAKYYRVNVSFKLSSTPMIAPDKDGLLELAEIGQAIEEGQMG